MKGLKGTLKTAKHDVKKMVDKNKLFLKNELEASRKEAEKASANNSAALNTKLGDHQGKILKSIKDAIEPIHGGLGKEDIQMEQTKGR